MNLGMGAVFISYEWHRVSDGGSPFEWGPRYRSTRFPIDISSTDFDKFSRLGLSRDNGGEFDEIQRWIDRGSSLYRPDQYRDVRGGSAETSAGCSGHCRGAPGAPVRGVQGRHHQHVSE